MASTGARRFRVLAIVLVVLIGLLIAADRISLVVAERVAGSTIQSSQELDERPDVSVAGFPFLNQLATSKFGKVTVTAHDIDVGQGSHVATLSSVKAVLHHVDTSRNFHRVHARTTTANASIDYPGLSRAVGFDVTSAGNGRVKASKEITAAGRAITAGVVTRPILSDGNLTFSDTQITGAGSLASEVSGQLTSLFRLTISLRQIPFNLHATSLDASSNGLAIVLQGADTTFTDR